MNAWRYRNAAVQHSWEFLDLAHDLQTEVAQLYAYAQKQPKQVEAFILANGQAVIDLVKAVPSRRLSILRRLVGGHTLSQMALILGAWQLCRKAVLAYDWIEYHPGHFTPGAAYRQATVEQGLLFDDLRARQWTRWPVQWGRSPFADEKSRQDPDDAPDFDEMMDRYDPSTGMY